MATRASSSLTPPYERGLEDRPGDGADRLITGELWLRGSPYGGQGLEHASTALRVSEMADLTSIGGFLIAPVVKVCFLPQSLEDRLRQVYWYRRYPGRMVQEVRLVPSNVRVYFHSKNTVGNNIRYLFDLFSVSSSAQAVQFETNFVRSTVAMLTLFARTLTYHRYEASTRASTSTTYGWTRTRSSLPTARPTSWTLRGSMRSLSRNPK